MNDRIGAIRKRMSFRGDVAAVATFLEGDAEVIELEGIEPDFSYTPGKDVDLSYIHRCADNL